MSRSVLRLPQADRDLIGCFASIGERVSLETAKRFLKAVDTDLRLIAKSPGVGAPHPTKNPRLLGLRCLRVSKFKGYLLFYRVFDDRIELVRVLHGARDIESILDADDQGIGEEPRRYPE
jgi:toxin ParE1/3/4